MLITPVSAQADRVTPPFKLAIRPSQKAEGRGETMRFALPVFVATLVAGCGANNATSLVDRIGEGASRLAREGGSSLRVSFDPIDAVQPYSAIFFPNRDVSEAEAVAGGVNKAIAHRIYTDLAYLGSMAGKIVVVQDGQYLQFTSAWKQLAEVQPPLELVVSKRRTGTAEIELRREAGTVRVVAIR
jgi:hypothetical protein